ncbi:hypothetical protein EON81_00495 [bacterium]|nr:MAG: hypothetical protein EON81_00495 [bacterium]
MLSWIVLTSAVACACYAGVWLKLPKEFRGESFRDHMLFFALAGAFLLSTTVYSVDHAGRSREAGKAARVLYAVQAVEASIQKGDDCAHFSTQVGLAEAEAELFRRAYPESLYIPAINKGIAPLVAAKRAWQYTLDTEVKDNGPLPYGMDWNRVTRSLDECGVHYERNQSKLFPGTLETLKKLGAERLPELGQSLSL